MASSNLEPVTTPWTDRELRHFLRRAGFGATPEGAAYYKDFARADTIDLVIDSSMRAEHPQPPDWIPERMEGPELREMVAGMSEDEARRRRNQIQAENRRATRRLQEWWLERMSTSSAFLREKMTLFWHGHFATSAEKVKQTALNFDIYRRLWVYGMGRFDQLALQVAQAPAMLLYLDNIRNVKGKPNENFARELFELFTLGIGNYTETDIKEAARAFTGWKDRKGEFFFARGQHDFGRKTVFGESGNFGGEDIIGLVMERPEMPRWIMRKLWTFFAFEQPDDALVEELAEAFRAEKFDLQATLRRLFLSRAFYSDRAIHAQIKSPTQYLLQIQGDLQARWHNEDLQVQAMRLLGQDLFYPPNVKGWDGGKAWINTNTLLLRVNAANYFVNGIMPELGNGRGGGGGGQKRPAQAAVVANQNAMINDAGMGGNMMSGDSKDGDSMGATRAPGPEYDSDDPRMMDDDAPAPEPVSRKVKPPLDLERLLERVGATSAPQLVDRCIERFLDMPVAADQRAALLAEVAKVKLPTKPDEHLKRADDQSVRAMIHMILSMAEYQLC